MGASGQFRFSKNSFFDTAKRLDLDTKRMRSVRQQERVVWGLNVQDADYLKDNLDWKHRVIPEGVVGPSLCQASQTWQPYLALDIFGPW